MKKYYKEFRDIFQGIIVRSCEGEGTKESPKRTVYYVFDTTLHKLGKIDYLKFDEE